MEKIILGTRGSPLALWQARHVKTALEAEHPSLEIEIKTIKTTGDKEQKGPLYEIGGKGLFIKELEEALLKHEIDFAVHSLKDVPDELPKGLRLAAFLKREDPRDALICRGGPAWPPLKGRPHRVAPTLENLPHGARIGTSSLRRQAQLLSLRPDLKCEPLRGNVETRLKKIASGAFDATFLAVAGLTRLGLKDKITEALSVETMIPAVGQGAIAIEIRADDRRTADLVRVLNHDETTLCVEAERAFLELLEGGCRTPIAAHAVIQGNQLKIIGMIGSPDGTKMVRGEQVGALREAPLLGISLAKDLLSRGGREILDEFNKI